MAIDHCLNFELMLILVHRKAQFFSLPLSFRIWFRHTVHLRCRIGSTPRQSCGGCARCEQIAHWGSGGCTLCWRTCSPRLWRLRLLAVGWTAWRLCSYLRARSPSSGDSLEAAPCQRVDLPYGAGTREGSTPCERTRSMAASSSRGHRVASTNRSRAHGRLPVYITSSCTSRQGRPPS
jgi:hypothetical protein